MLGLGRGRVLLIFRFLGFVVTELWDLKFFSTIALSMTQNNLQLHEKIFINFICDTKIRQRKAPFDYQTFYTPA